MAYRVSVSTLSHNLRMTVVEDGVFNQGWASNGIELWETQAKYADITRSQQVIEQMDSMSAKLSPPREVWGRGAGYAVGASK